MQIFEPLIITFFLGNLYLFCLSIYQTKFQNNPYGLTRWLLPLGIFVWGDGVVLTVFWSIVALGIFFFGSLYDFWMIYSLFWIVRSFGEIFYWLFQQFSSVKRDPPETVPFSNIFPGESVWFAMQVIWQVVLIISLYVFFQLQKL